MRKGLGIGKKAPDCSAFFEAGCAEKFSFRRAGLDLD
jgi:hypothetical protein